MKNQGKEKRNDRLRYYNPHAVVTCTALRSYVYLISQTTQTMRVVPEEERKNVSIFTSTAACTIIERVFLSYKRDVRDSIVINLRKAGVRLALMKRPRPRKCALIWINCYLVGVLLAERLPKHSFTRYRAYRLL